MTLRKKQVTIILSVFAVLLIADQVTKALVVHYVPLGGPRFEGREEAFFYITHQRNEGLVGGMFSGNRIITFTAPIVASLILLYLFRHLDPRSTWQSIAYGMVAAGAAGNLIDRMRQGYVTDFLQVHFVFIPFDFPWKRYPAFNIADSAICVGVVLLIVCWHRVQEEPEAHVADSA